MSASEQAIIEEILADAQRQAERILRRARRDADRAVSRAEEQARREADAVLDAGRKQARARVRAIAAGTDQEVKNQERRARERIIETVRRDAWDQTRACTQDRCSYVEVLAGLICEATAQMGGDAFRVAFRSEDDSIAEAALEAARTRATKLGRGVRLERSDDTVDSAAGGCVILSEDGRRRADETFEARLRRLWPQIRRHAAEIVFGNSPPDPKADQEA